MSSRPNWLRRRESAGSVPPSVEVVAAEVLTVAEIDARRVDVWGEMLRNYLARYPHRTRSGYRVPLRRWEGWCRNHGVEPVEVTRRHLEVWMRHLSEEAGLANQTVAGYVGVVAGCYRLAHADGVIADDPSAHLRRPKQPRVSTTNGLDAAELVAVLAEAKQREPWVDAAVHILGMNGTRSGETRAIDVEHLGEHGDWMTIHLPHRKGGVVSTLSLTAETERAVRRAVDCRDSGPLLAHLEGHYAGERIGRRMMQRQFQSVVTAAGIERRITPHSLRHTFVTLSLDAHCDIRDIMASTGHTDPSMITYYDRARASIERNTTHQLAAHLAEIMSAGGPVTSGVESTQPMSP